MADVPSRATKVGHHLRIFEANYGPDHPTVAIRLNNLAELLRATHRHADAEPLFRRVVRIFEASYGPDHPTVAITLNNLAELLRATNRHADAEPLFQRALAIYEKSYEPDHPNLAATLNSLAMLLEDTGRHAEAEPLYARGLRMLSRFQQLTGHQHPNWETVVNNYRDFLTSALRMSEEQATARIREVLGLDVGGGGAE